MLALGISPVVAWSVFFLGVGLFGDLRWPPEIWGGAIAFAALSGIALTTLSPTRTSNVQDKPLVATDSA